MIRIRPDGTGLWVMQSPYDLRIIEVAKRHHGRWNPEAHVWYWTLPIDARRAADDLRQFGFEVDLEGATAPPPPPPRQGRTSNPWTAVFTSLPRPLRDKVYKAVVRVLHPDHGGDLAAMQQLTAAYAQTEQR